MTFWIDGISRDAAPTVGERFEIGNANKPAWAQGWFEVTGRTDDGRIICKRVEGPNK